MNEGSAKVAVKADTFHGFEDKLYAMLREQAAGLETSDASTALLKAGMVAGIGKVLMTIDMLRGDNKHDSE